MSFYVYILFSESVNQYYVGHTEDPEDRIFRHKNSGNKSAKKANDWVIKYTGQFESRSAAIRRELEIKNKKSRKYIEWLFSSPNSYRDGKVVPPGAECSSQNKIRLQLMCKFIL